MEGLSDAEIMSRVRSGDRAAFAELVDRYKDALVGYLARLTHCRDRAEDVAQESFLRLYQAAPRYSEQGRLAPYLYRIATNLVRSEERRQRRWRFLSAAFSSNGDRSEPSPQALLLQSETRDRVLAALRSLPTVYRAPVVLRDIDGWTYEDISRALGCREGTVKSRINRARRQLRDLLMPYLSRGK